MKRLQTSFCIPVLGLFLVVNGATCLSCLFSAINHTLLSTHHCCSGCDHGEESHEHHGVKDQGCCHHEGDLEDHSTSIPIAPAFSDPLMAQLLNPSSTGSTSMVDSLNAAGPCLDPAFMRWWARLAVPHERPIYIEHAQLLI